MVKTNKKSLIAMIAMVVLLIASIAMGITGAWFTASGSADSTDGTLKFGSVSLTMVADTTNNGIFHTNGTAVAAEADGSYLLVPGDKVVSKVTLTNTSDVDVYYLVKKGDTYYKLNEANNGFEELTTAAAQEWTAGSSELTLDFGFEIETSAKYGDTILGVEHVQGGEAIAISGGTWKIAMIQKDNCDAATALTQLQAILAD